MLPDDCIIMPSYDVFIADVKGSQNEVNKWLGARRFLKSLTKNSAR